MSHGQQSDVRVIRFKLQGGSLIVSAIGTVYQLVLRRRVIISGHLMYQIIIQESLANANVKRATALHV